MHVLLRGFKVLTSSTLHAERDYVCGTRIFSANEEHNGGLCNTLLARVEALQARHNSEWRDFDCFSHAPSCVVKLFYDLLLRCFARVLISHRCLQYWHWWWRARCKDWALQTAWRSWPAIRRDHQSFEQCIAALPPGVYAHTDQFHWRHAFGCHWHRIITVHCCLVCLNCADFSNIGLWGGAGFARRWRGRRSWVPPRWRSPWVFPLCVTHPCAHRHSKCSSSNDQNGFR